MRYNVKSKFEIVADLPDVIAIEDLDGLMSVTNDAENVVRYLARIGLGKRRLLYRDPEGIWDELLHDSGGAFMGFRALRCQLLNDALRRVREPLTHEPATVCLPLT
jgi:hypothetical protein